jgi:predicted nucleic acid-binding protein
VELEKESKEIILAYSGSRWCIDTNTLVPWLITDSGVLDLLVKKYKIPSDFRQIYLDRHKPSIDFIQGIIDLKSKGLPDEFYFSYLAMNEVYSAVRDEIRCILLFRNGAPLSRWNEEKNSIDLPNDSLETVYEDIQKKFDVLFGNGTIVPLSDEPEEKEGDNFSEIVASLIFKFKRVKTQDAILLTTAISIKAKYFVTFDKRLIEEVSKDLAEKYHLHLIIPNEGNSQLKKIQKQNK